MKKLNQEEFISKLTKINPSIHVIGEYDGSYVPVECSCKKCGYSWNPVPHNILSGSGCPNCSHSATSFVEQFILKAFQKILGKGKVINRDKISIGKELDIFIPSLNLAIEPGAWILHKKGLKKDTIKKQLCKEKGIDLITIYYGCNEEFEDTDVITFKHNFERETEFKDLQNLVYLLFDIAKIKHEFKEYEWIELKNEAYLDSRKITTDVFKSKINEINPNLIILSEYKSSTERIKTKCKICENVWYPIAHSLMQRRGCPKCANTANADRLRLNEAQFLEKLKSINPNIESLDKYIDSKTKIQFRCTICEHQWKTIPAVLFLGHGCPNCAGRPKINTQVFKERMKSINPNIEIKGEYVNTSTKLECSCKVCNNIWLARPHDLQSGRGCPICGNKRKGIRK